jgi:cell division septum initiation protein DivIVA
LRVRETISRLTDRVNDLRSVREQLLARSKALEGRKGESAVAELLSSAQTAIGKTNTLEGRLHNPTAEVVYDILAMRGGTRLYSRLAPLLMWAIEGTGAPTAGMTQVLEAQEKELADLERETREFLTTDVASINDRASRLGVGFVVVGPGIVR